MPKVPTTSCAIIPVMTGDNTNKHGGNAVMPQHRSCKRTLAFGDTGEIIIHIKIILYICHKDYIISSLQLSVGRVGEKVSKNGVIFTVNTEFFRTSEILEIFPIFRIFVAEKYFFRKSIHFGGV